MNIRSIAASALLACSLPAFATAGDPGTVANFDDGDLFTLNAVQTTVTLVPDDGVGGPGNGYASMATDFEGNLGANIFAPEFTGNLNTSGVTGFSFWLRDTGADDPLEIHVGFGSAFVDVYFYIEGFTPPENGWERFEVDLTDPSKWIQTKGNGSFNTAKANCNRLVFRHDLAPIIGNPDIIQGDFGIDRIAVMPCAYEVYGIGAGGNNTLYLDTTSNAQVGQTQTLVSGGSLPGATGFLVASPSSVALPALGGTLLVDPTTALLVPVAADGLGTVTLPLFIPDDASLYGLDVFFQTVTRDANVGSGWRLSNGLATAFCAP